MTARVRYQPQANGSGVWFDLGPWYPKMEQAVDYAKRKAEEEGFDKVRVIRRTTLEIVMWKRTP
jgi:uncharacterized protein Usg